MGRGYKHSKSIAIAFGIRLVIVISAKVKMKTEPHAMKRAIGESHAKTKKSKPRQPFPAKQENNAYNGGYHSDCDLQRSS